MNSLSELPNAVTMTPKSLKLICKAVEKGQEAARAAMREREVRKEHELHLFPVRF